MCDIGMVKLR